MLDHALAQKTFWERFVATTVATTGSQTLEATALGYKRATGSFLTDGFATGMEVYATGYNAGNNAPSIVQDVTTGFITITGGRTVQSPTAGRAIIAGVPKLRQRDNADIIDSETGSATIPAPGTRPYVGDDWVPAVADLIASPKDGGHLEENGLYLINWFGLANRGILAIRRSVDAVRARFSPGTIISVGSDYVHCVSAVAGKINRMENNTAWCQITIRWRCASVNSIAA